MKFIKYIAGLCAAAAMVGCVNPFEPYDAIYITQAQSSVDLVLSVDAPPATTSFSVSSSVRATEDVTVNIAVTPEKLEAYNAKYGRTYQMAPEGSYTLSADKAVIEAGFNVSDDIEVQITDISEFAEGVTYCIPVSATSSSAMTVLEPSSTVYIVLRTPVISKAIAMGSNRYIVPGFMTDASLSALPQLTLETMVYVNGFAGSDPYISSIMGIEGTCGVRFGDVKIEPNVVQICHESYQPAATAAPCNTGTWYHVAAVWTGSTWDIYINGQYITGTTTAGETIDLTNVGSCGFQLGASYSHGRPLNGYMAETRVWTRALTRAEIANNMYYVDPQSDGLLAYWRMNAWESAEQYIAAGDRNGYTYRNVVRDATGHGYDAYGMSAEPGMIDVKWSY